MNEMIVQPKQRNLDLTRGASAKEAPILKTDVNLASEPVPSDSPTFTRDIDRENEEPHVQLLMDIRDCQNRSFDFWDRIYRTAQEDMEFIYVNQWPAEAKQGRKNRPTLTMNS